MPEFFTNYWGTLLVGGIVLALLVGIVIKMLHNKRKGKGSCGCGCDSCPAANSCHQPAVKKSKKKH
mgnify:CR=1 FL=1